MANVTWPLEVMRKVYGDGSTLLVELDCDEVAVIHIVQEGLPESDSIAVGGSTLKITGDARLETWTYLDDESAARLRDGLTQLLDSPVPA